MELPAQPTLTVEAWWAHIWCFVNSVQLLLPDRLPKAIQLYYCKSVDVCNNGHESQRSSFSSICSTGSGFPALSYQMGQEADDGDKQCMQLPGQVKDEDEDDESFTQMQAGTLGITGNHWDLDTQQLLSDSWKLSCQKTRKHSGTQMMRETRLSTNILSTSLLSKVLHHSKRYTYINTYHNHHQ